MEIKEIYVADYNDKGEYDIFKVKCNYYGPNDFEIYGDNGLIAYKKNEFCKYENEVCSINGTLLYHETKAGLIKILIKKQRDHIDACIYSIQESMKEINYEIDEIKVCANYIDKLSQDNNICIDFIKNLPDEKNK